PLATDHPQYVGISRAQGRRIVRQSLRVERHYSPRCERGKFAHRSNRNEQGKRAGDSFQLWSTEFKSRRRSKFNPHRGVPVRSALNLALVPAWCRPGWLQPNFRFTVLTRCRNGEANEKRNNDFSH